MVHYRPWNLHYEPQWSLIKPQTYSYILNQVFCFFICFHNQLLSKQTFSGVYSLSFYNNYCKTEWMCMFLLLESPIHLAKSSFKERTILLFYTNLIVQVKSSNEILEMKTQWSLWKRKIAQFCAQLRTNHFTRIIAVFKYILCFLSQFLQSISYQYFLRQIAS